MDNIFINFMKNNCYEISVLETVRSIEDKQLIEEIFNFSKLTEDLFTPFSNNNLIYYEFDNILTRREVYHYKSFYVDRYYCIRQALVRNIYTPKNILLELVEDKNPAVQREFLQRDDLNNDILEKILYSVLEHIPPKYMHEYCNSFGTLYQFIYDILMNKKFTNINVFNEANLEEFITKLSQKGQKILESMYLDIAYKFNLKIDLEKLHKMNRFIYNNILNVDNLTSDMVLKVYYKAQESLNDWYNVAMYITKKVDINKIPKEFFIDFIQGTRGVDYDFKFLNHFADRKIVEDLFFGKGLLFFYDMCNIIFGLEYINSNLVNMIFDIAIESSAVSIVHIVNILFCYDNVDLSLLREDIQEKIYSCFNLSEYELQYKLLRSAKVSDEFLIEKSKIKDLRFQLALLENSKYIEEVYHNIVQYAFNNYVKKEAIKRLNIKQ